MKTIIIKKQLTSLILIRTILFVRMSHTHIGEKVTTNNIYTFVFIIILLQDIKEAKEVVFPSSNKVTEVDESWG